MVEHAQHAQQYRARIFERTERFGGGRGGGRHGAKGAILILAGPLVELLCVQARNGEAMLGSGLAKLALFLACSVKELPCNRCKFLAERKGGDFEPSEHRPEIKMVESSGMLFRADSVVQLP